MRNTGMVKEIDEVGRLVLPKKVREPLGIGKGDAIRIYTEGDKIILEKVQDACVFCGAVEDTVTFNEKCLCKSCLAQIKDLA